MTGQGELLDTTRKQQIPWQLWHFTSVRASNTASELIHTEIGAWTRPWSSLVLQTLSMHEQRMSKIQTDAAAQDQERITRPFRNWAVWV